MISGLLKSIFGSRNDRLLKTYRKHVERINALEHSMEALSDDALQAKTGEFRTRLAGGETLDALLPEAFAVVREASKRVLGMRHFDVQLVGGMVLHYGKIAEMRTGEGKTLVSTLPAYLNALAGTGVHIVTVNDYLARRDAEWMGQLHRWLGLDVGCNLAQLSSEEKRAAYACDITYGTNNEFGFDYLRDNMVYDVQDRVQRKLHYAIVDEVDSILIDEARTPLIISGQAEDHTELYVRMNALAPMLTRCQEENGPGDFWVDEKANQVLLTEEGHESAERILVQAGMLAEGHSLYEASNILLMHHLTTALRAHNLFHRDQHYVIQDDEVVIVDEFTGRLMSGRRWSDGLHQAVEAKENVAIQHENQTLASITFQNYFRMYGKLAGMTGTADTEAYEFQQIYGLETVVIPTHRPAVRKDQQDQIYRTDQEKYKAIVADIRAQHAAGRPILVGTTSIENSELLSDLLKREKLEHQVLNAKQHEREAEIVAQAGKPGMITIATNMAGRGTDIVLGGNIGKQVDAIRADAKISDAAKEEKIAALRAEWQKTHDAVIAAGGLHIIGSERHESRRIDNQLRGRAGRQGDAGSSRFFLSLDDSLLRIFAGDRIKSIMDRLKMPEGEAIEHAIVTRSLESAQRKVEGRNFDIRKQLLEYDNVANDQRRVIYGQRNELLETHEIAQTMTALRHGLLEEVFRTYVPEGSIDEQWDLPTLENVLEAEYQLRVPLAEMAQGADAPDDEALLERLIAAADEVYAAKVALVGDESFSGFERSVMLRSLDTHWREHLSALDHLRQGIHLRGYAQKDPKQEYKREAFELFDSMLSAVRREVTRTLMTVRIATQEEIDAAAAAEQAALSNVSYEHGGFVDQDGNAYDPETVNRNAPCPCGSGEKFKHCHGRML
ncbi:MAG: preprotein translocase subunit SecA [Rhodocyclaceae bacterium]|nr:preprotein translocase subunit SecA [Rhodocyclaceae bacterium]